MAEENSKHFPNAQYFRPVALRSGLEIELGEDGVAKWHFYSKSVITASGRSRTNNVLETPVLRPRGVRGGSQRAVL